MSNRIRFLADEDFRGRIVSGVLRRQPTIDFQTVQAAKLIGTPDPELLVIAAKQGRIIVSHDLSTMPTHFAAFLESSQHSPGLFLINQNFPVVEAIEELLMIWEASTAEEWSDQIRHLPL